MLYSLIGPHIVAPFTRLLHHFTSFYIPLRSKQVLHTIAANLTFHNPSSINLGLYLPRNSRCTHGGKIPGVHRTRWAASSPRPGRSCAAWRHGGSSPKGSHPHRSSGRFNWQKHGQKRNKRLGKKWNIGGRSIFLDNLGGFCEKHVLTAKRKTKWTINEHGSWTFYA